MGVSLPVIGFFSHGSVLCGLGVRHDSVGAVHVLLKAPLSDHAVEGAR